MSDQKSRREFHYLLLAALATAAIWQVPYGDKVLYLFTLFGTWCHEMGHGLTAKLLGGTFEKIDVTLQAGGVASYTIGSNAGRGIVAIGGLVGPAVAGAILLILGSKPGWATWVLRALAAVMVGSMLLLGIFSAGMWIIACLGIAIFAATHERVPVMAQRLLLNFLGVQMSINVFQRMDYLFMRSANTGISVGPSDVSVVADTLLLPLPFWSYSISALSVFILWWGLRRSYLR